jgi:hypothetical protein
MPITLTSLTFSTPQELVTVLSTLEGTSLTQLLNNMHVEVKESVSSSVSGENSSAQLSKALGTSDMAMASQKNNNTTTPEKNKTSGKSVAKHTVKKERYRAKGATLVDQIKSLIQQHMDKKKEFTANTIFTLLEAKDPSINKKSVVSSVQKLMQEGRFAKIKREERRDGSAPRAKKYYMP